MGEKEGFNIFKAMAYIDRKYLFLMIFVVVLGPILFPVGIPIKIGKNTRLYYSYLDELESGDVVYWIGATYRSFMEVKSGYVATLRTIIEKDAKLIVVIVREMNRLFSNRLWEILIRIHQESLLLLWNSVITITWKIMSSLA